MRAFGWFLGLIALGLASIAVFTYPAWTWLHPHFDFPFHRMGERIGMLTLLLGLIASAPRLKLNDRVSLGYGNPRRVFLRETALGLVLGAVTMALVVIAMSFLGLREWTVTPPASASGSAAYVCKLLVSRLLSGVAVAFIEETFLRGAVHTAIERESGPAMAVLLTAILYATTHFFVSFHIPAAEVTAASGFDLLAGTLHAFSQPLAIGDAFLCLFAVGVVLGLIRVATGNIAADVGLHAGWVWVMLVAHDLSQPVRTAPLAFLLSRFDGFVGWLVLAWTVLLGIALQRFYRVRAARVRAA